MSDIEVTIDDSQVRELIARTSEANMLKVIGRGMARGLAVVWGKLPEYPPPRTFTQMTRKQAQGRHLWSRGATKVAGVRGRWWVSTYKRTGTLRKSISAKVEMQSDAVIGRIGTNVTKQTASSGYAEYVIGMPNDKPYGQAWMHQGRWWSLQPEVEKNAGDISAAIGDEIETELAK